jgi:hypothetical protein
MNRNKRIDFLLIGAQKSGTTSLYQYLVAHPQVFMPKAKEVEFFSDDSRFSRGLEWYWNTYFSAAPAEARKGEATTQYMMYPDVPKRIRDAFPDVRLIAILRNPIDRAFSHYRMMAMRGEERRPFAECVKEVVGQDEYLRFGEYGRILTEYLMHFDRRQLCVLFAEELARAPAAQIAHAFEFIGVDPTFRPDNLDKQYNIGGDARFRRTARLLMRAAGRVHRTPLLGRLFTQDRYEAFKFWTRTELTVRHERDALDSHTRARLVEYFARDVALLRKRLGVSVPWSDFTEAAGTQLFGAAR